MVITSEQTSEIQVIFAFKLFLALIQLINHLIIFSGY